tara:strand:- start:76743 stop:77036 length:294 start_codon:yes stop_codon:yes gene_type:complete
MDNILKQRVRDIFHLRELIIARGQWPQNEQEDFDKTGKLPEFAEAGMQQSMDSVMNHCRLSDEIWLYDMDDGPFARTWGLAVVHDGEIRYKEVIGRS